MSGAAPEAWPTASSGAGWRAELALEFESSEHGTRLTRRRHIGPLLVQRAFHPEGPVPCHVYVIHPPGGVAGGDDLRIAVDLKPGAHALLTTPAAGKFYRRGAAGPSRAVQAFRVEDAVLEWLPQENILYPNAAAQLCSTVNLAGRARFIGWEIACLGLPANRRDLEGGELRLGFELWHEGVPVLLERLVLAGEALSARWGMAGHSSLGTLLCYPADPAILQLARAHAPANCAELTFACTLVDGALVCRAMAGRADRLRQAFVALWRVLRPALVGREAVPPRIWTT